jgi:hypothetical protein
VLTREQLAALDEAKKTAARSMISRSPFQNRKFSNRTIDALVAYGMDAPERLLFMQPSDIRKIPGIGKASLAEIDAYIRRFKEASLKRSAAGAAQ